MQGCTPSPLGKERGFSLIEVLVTVLVFSIGMLGIAGLSTVGRRATFDTVQRSTAAELAYALLEEMRSNNEALGVYVAAAVLGRGSRGSSEPAPDCDAAGAACTADELATHSLWAWEQMLDTGFETVAGAGTGGLVTPTACIVGPAGGVAGNYTVTMVWRGVSELADPAINACGAATGLYGTSGEFRRMAVVQTYIDPLN